MLNNGDEDESKFTKNLYREKVSWAESTFIS